MGYFLAVTGAPFPEGFFSRIEEVTAKAIVHQALADSPAETRSRIEEEVCREYLALLERAHSKNPDSFPPTTGALEVLAYLEAQDNLSIAIATGDWTETISFKLEAASIETAHYPMATSSDRYA